MPAHVDAGIWHEHRPDDLLRSRPAIGGPSTTDVFSAVDPGQRRRTGEGDDPPAVTDRSHGEDGIELDSRVDPAREAWADSTTRASTTRDGPTRAGTTRATLVADVVHDRREHVRIARHHHIDPVARPTAPVVLVP